MSSKVNQWTLLVGTLPIVFAIAAGGLHGLPVDAHQREELFLTAAQSFFAVAVLVTLSISVREAWVLFALFWAQFIIGGLAPASIAGLERIVVGGVYIVLGLVIFTRQRGLIRPLIRDGFKTLLPGPEPPRDPRRVAAAVSTPTATIAEWTRARSSNG